MLDLIIFLLTRFFLRYCHMLLLLTLLLWAPVSGGCILPPNVQHLLHVWTGLINWLIVKVIRSHEAQSQNAP